jgi:hypothetical protein
MLHGGARAPVIFDKPRQFNLQNVAIYIDAEMCCCQRKRIRECSENISSGASLCTTRGSRPLRRLRIARLLVVSFRRGREKVT